MAEDFTNSTPGTGATATAELPVTSTGTVQPNGDANGQGAPIEEAFTHVDPKTLPPQLRSVYENMNRDYKEKTTRISETTKAEIAKATEAYRSKAEQYDQLATQEEFVKQWNEYVQKVQSTPTSQVDGDPALAQMKAQLQEMNQKIQINELAQVTEAFAEAVNEKGDKIHPDFDQLNSISVGQLQTGSGVEDFSLLRACIELAPGKDPTEKLAAGYKTAKATYDAIFESGKKAGMGRLQTKVQNGSLPPINAGGDVLSMTDKKPRNAREALEMAKRGQVVSRE